MKQELYSILTNDFIKIILACPIHPNAPKKCILRPICIKESTLIQKETFQNNQAFHKNMSPDEALTDIETALKKDFSEIYVFFKNEEWHGRIKKNHLSFKKKKSEQERKKDTAHNKQKSYPIPEGIFIPALSELGIIDTKGRVFPHNGINLFKSINF